MFLDSQGYQLSPSSQLKNVKPLCVSPELEPLKMQTNARILQTVSDMRTQPRVMSCLYIHTCIAWHLGAFEEEIENLVQHFANLLDEGHME